MCDCISKNKIDLAARFAKELAGKAEVDERAELPSLGIRQIGNKLVAVGTEEYRLRTWPLKKDGTSTGREKMLSIPVVYSYCPHCGEKLAE